MFEERLARPARRLFQRLAVTAVFFMATAVSGHSAEADGNCVVSSNDPDATVATLRDVCTEAELRSLFSSLSSSPMPAYGARATGYIRLAVDAEQARGLGVDTYLISLLVWKGKVFYTHGAGGHLYNLVGPFGTEDQRADVYHGPFPYDNGTAIVVHYPEDNPTNLGSQTVRDYIRKVAPGVYLGLALTPPRGLPTDHTHVMSFILDFNHPDL